MTAPETSLSTLDQVVRPTTVVESGRLNARLGARVLLASETFQHTGSFKFRAGYNVAAKVPQRLLITASSGNFGQALAYACSLLGKASIVVMPATSAAVKVDAVREYSGRVELIDVRTTTRAARVGELARQYPDAYVASAYDDPLVIEGNSSLGREIAALGVSLDNVIAPVGGGGLTSGLFVGLGSSGRTIPLIGAEPLMANDAARSLRSGQLVSLDAEPETLADGARTLSLGRHNWEILRDNLARIVEVPEEKIIEAVRMLFLLANLKAEPTGALSLAAVLTEPEMFRDRTICCVISGGNVDPLTYRAILAT